ncbi:hypothetical protein E2C01_020610 [Portunus trituberculatus]|uniref:Uncharacterized protein n=1 Tax=Portunus trituberculatus TaxID=210409 RepID=A0A5B7E0C6_PORTR|nr:hypothetical protein [Portunus trituberculatus]
MRSAHLRIAAAVVVVAWLAWARDAVVFLKERKAGACGSGYLTTYAVSNMLCAMKSSVGLTFARVTWYLLETRRPRAARSRHGHGQDQETLSVLCCVVLCCADFCVSLVLLQPTRRCRTAVEGLAWWMRCKASCGGFSFVKDASTSGGICRFHESVSSPDGNPDATCYILSECQAAEATLLAASVVRGEARDPKTTITTITTTTPTTTTTTTKISTTAVPSTTTTTTTTTAVSNKMQGGRS